MKPKLEDLIRDAAKRGTLTHLSVIGSWNKGEGVTYKASVRVQHEVCFGEAADPVDALIDALIEAFTDPTA